MTRPIEAAYTTLHKHRFLNAISPLGGSICRSPPGPVDLPFPRSAQLQAQARALAGLPAGTSINAGGECMPRISQPAPGAVLCD